MMKITRKMLIVLIVALILVVSTVNTFIVKSELISGSAVLEIMPVEFPGISLAVILASVLGAYLVIKQHHMSK